MTREQYKSLQLVQLKELAKSRGLKHISTLKKDELIDRMLEEDARESEEKERAVGISEEKRLSDICEDPIWNSRSDHEPSGKIRKKSFFYGIQCGEKTDRI